MSPEQARGEEVDHQAKIRWAREEALPELEQLVGENWRDFIEPYKLAEKVEKYIYPVILRFEVSI